MKRGVPSIVAWSRVFSSVKQDKSWRKYSLPLSPSRLSYETRPWILLFPSPSGFVASVLTNGNEKRGEGDTRDLCLQSETTEAWLSRSPSRCLPYVLSTGLFSSNGLRPKLSSVPVDKAE